MSFKFFFLFNATSHPALFVLSFTVFNFFISKDFLGGIFAFYWIPTGEINGEKKSRGLTCRSGCGLSCWGNICHTLCTINTWTLFHFFQLVAKLYARCCDGKYSGETIQFKDKVRDEGVTSQIKLVWGLPYISRLTIQLQTLQQIPNQCCAVSKVNLAWRKWSLKRRYMFQSSVSLSAALREDGSGEEMILRRFSGFVPCMGSCHLLFICPTGISCLSAR